MIHGCTFHIRRLSRQLKSADFFDVARSPVIKLRGCRVEGDPGTQFRLIGDLTIKDVTREVVLEVESHGEGGARWWRAPTPARPRGTGAPAGAPPRAGAG